MSTSLFDRVSVLDAEAWRKFVRIYGPLIFFWCRRDGLSDEDAADVGQEVFRAVAAGIGRYERQPGKAFAGWLRTITRNKTVDFWRRRERSPVAVGGSEFQARLGNEPSVEADVADSDDNRLAILARGTLACLRSQFSERHWSAFWETTVNNRSSADVAQDLGMTAMAVRKVKSRVMRRLRDELADELP
jgi:RNA polymerase sigma-70 factor (ECF subfamily)